MFARVHHNVAQAVAHTNAEALFDWTMADESLLTSPDIETWRASLAADQHAAMNLRHNIDGISHTATHTRPGDTCPEMVHKGALYEQCGAPIDDNGVCEAGHHTK